MADFELSLPQASHPSLSRFVTRLRDRLEVVVGSEAKVSRSAGEKDEESFSQSVRVTAPNEAALEVLVEWEKDTGKLEINVSPVSNAPGFVKFVSVAFIVVAVILADQSPELLPVFRGLRVILGGLVGLVVGLLVQTVVTKALSKKSAPLDPALEAQVREVVGEIVEGGLQAA